MIKVFYDLAIRRLEAAYMRLSMAEWQVVERQGG